MASSLSPFGMSIVFPALAGVTTRFDVSIAETQLLNASYLFGLALGVGVGTVVSRAVVRDTCDAVESARALSLISAAMGVAPMIGPVIGGGLSARFGITAIFLISALLGIGVSAALAVGLTEPPRPETPPLVMSRRHGGPAAWDCCVRHHSSVIPSSTPALRAASLRFWRWDRPSSPGIWESDRSSSASPGAA
ncbi:MAG: MFS transporter [Gammaproteobacteria bacterium]|nr:MFS transporter [Gammaproteobacteria bacterium]